MRAFRAKLRRRRHHSAPCRLFLAGDASALLATGQSGIFPAAAQTQADHAPARSLVLRGLFPSSLWQRDIMTSGSARRSGLACPLCRTMMHNTGVSSSYRTCRPDRRASGSHMLPTDPSRSSLLLAFPGSQTITDARSSAFLAGASAGLHHTRVFLGAQVAGGVDREKGMCNNEAGGLMDCIGSDQGTLDRVLGDLECCLHALGSLESTRKRSATSLSALLVAAAGFEPATKGL